NLHSSNTAEGTVSPTSLTFTPNNFGIPQVVTVTGVDDTVVDGNIPYTITFDTSVSNDARFNNLAVSNVSVTNLDNDALTPTVTINQAAGQDDPTSTSPIQFTVVFSTPVTGFTASDLSFAGSTVGGTLVANVSGSGANYTVSVTGMNGNGNVMASIPAG